MMKKIVAFGASNSRNSINKKLAEFAANQLENTEINLLDLNDFEMPIYGPDKEDEIGIPVKAHEFKEQMIASDGIIISFAEYNGSYTAAFKNVMDWVSRTGKDMWGNKPMFLLATSPGPRGGKTVLEAAVNRFKFVNQNTIVSFSLPSFDENFVEGNGIVNKELYNTFSQQLKVFIESM